MLTYGSWFEENICDVSTGSLSPYAQVLLMPA